MLCFLPHVLHALFHWTFRTLNKVGQVIVPLSRWKDIKWFAQGHTAIKLKFLDLNLDLGNKTHNLNYFTVKYIVENSNKRKDLISNYISDGKQYFFSKRTNYWEFVRLICYQWVKRINMKRKKVDRLLSRLFIIV